MVIRALSSGHVSSMRLFSLVPIHLLFVTARRRPRTTIVTVEKTYRSITLSTPISKRTCNSLKSLHPTTSQKPCTSHCSQPPTHSPFRISNTTQPPILRQHSIALLVPDLPALAANTRSGIEQVARINASFGVQQARVRLAAAVELVLPVRLHGVRLVEVGAAARAGRRHCAPGPP